MDESDRTTNIKLVTLKGNAEKSCSILETSDCNNSIPSGDEPNDALYHKIKEDPELVKIASVGVKERQTVYKKETQQEMADPSLYLKNELYKKMSDEPAEFEWIQSALGDGIWYYDMEKNTEWYSPDFKKLFGYEDWEVPNVPSWWQENIFPEDLPDVLHRFGEHIRTGSPYDHIVRYRHKNGSTVWVRCHGKAFFNKDGIPIRMLGAHNDFTELMNVQEELRKKEAILDLLCTTSLDGYWDWNIKTGDVFMSVRWKKILGYEDSEIRNRVETWWSLLLPEDAAKLHDAVEMHKTKGDTPLNVVLRYRRKDGTIAHMLTQGVAKKDDSTGEWIHVFGTYTDVSYLEETRAIREASAAKTTFLATMSHEIRTPLNAVLGMAQVLMTTELTEEQLECVNILHNSGGHLLSLINDILDFSQIESGVVRMTTEDINLETTLRNVLLVLQHSANQKNVALCFNSSIPIGSVFRGDSERLRQIIFNLVGNAVKFTTVGSVVVTIAPEVRNDTLGFVLTVKDTGCGIDKNDIGHIFDDFRQASNAIRSEYGGSGLGLSICKKIVHAKNGTIDVQSELGHGSVFSVWLPGLMLPDTTPTPTENDAYDVENETTTTSTLQLQTAAAVPSSPCCVILFEELDVEEGSVLDRIHSTGVTVNRVQTFPELLLLNNLRDRNVVVVHQQSLDISDKAMEFIKYTLEQTTLPVYYMGLKPCTGMEDERYKKRCGYLSSFSTSEEIRTALTKNLDFNVDGGDGMVICSNTSTTTNKTNRAKERMRQQQSKTEDPLSTSDEHRFRVMVAEDNFINQKVIKRLLSRCDCDVDFANNGAEAVQLAMCGRKWDIILMDLLMPVMDGLEATRQIRLGDKKTPIVALTANATTGDRDQCYDAGMNDFITKPVSLDILRQTLDRYCT